MGKFVLLFFKAWYPMTKKIVLFIFSLLLLTQAYSQIKPFRFGLKAAPNLAWITPDSKGYKADGSALGFSWGFLADFTLTDNYFIKTGFSMDFLNSKLSFPYSENINNETQTGEMHRKYNLRYLQIPLSIKMRTNQFNKIAYYGEIGFGTSFNIRARSQDEFIVNGQSSLNADEDISNEVAFLRESLIIGLGVEYFIDQSTSLMAGISFDNGLTNMLKGYNTFDPNVKQKGKMYYFSLNVGVMF